MGGKWWSTRRFRTRLLEGDRSLTLFSRYRDLHEWRIQGIIIGCGKILASLVMTVAVCALESGPVEIGSFPCKNGDVLWFSCERLPERCGHAKIHRHHAPNTILAATNFSETKNPTFGGRPSPGKSMALHWNWHYPLANVCKNYGKSACLMEKFTSFRLGQFQ